MVQVFTPDLNSGVASSPSVLRTTAQVQLRYGDGAPCSVTDTNGNVVTGTRSTVVLFDCPRNSNGDAKAGVRGDPEYLAGDNCTNRFRWTSSFACPTDTFAGDNCMVPTAQGMCTLVGGGFMAGTAC
jgi:hypothetical protein